MAIGQANGLDRCAQTEQHQHVHQHVHFTPEQLNRMTDEQLDRTEAAYTAGGRQYVTVPVGGAAIFRLSNYAAELEAPLGSNMLVTFALPE